MRTCPACGKDTEAGSVEPCTECGFSPVDPEQFETEPDPRYETLGFEPEAEPTFEVGSAEAPPAPVPAPTDPIPAPPSGEPAPEKPKRRRWVGAAIWIAIAAGAGIANLTGVLDEATGPTPDEVEGALVVFAAERGGSLTVECPSDTEETEVGASFDCIATNLRGQTRTVTVTNDEDNFEWDGTPLIQLIRRDR